MCNLSDKNTKFLKYLNDNFRNESHNPDKINLKDIFSAKWDDFLHDNPNIVIRDIVHKEVEKLISCKTFHTGFYSYQCTDCGKTKNVPFTCKSRFCPSCGMKYVLDRANTITKKCVNCKHRHLVFTIPDTLRIFFLKDRSLLNILFQAVADTLNSWVNQLNKSQNFKPAFISTLHTFGRDLKWNPHIHVLFAELALGNGTYKKLPFIPYDMLRKRFRTTLLSSLEKIIGKDNFRAIKNDIYSKNENGFYVFARPDSCKNVKSTVKYVIRYSGKPAIAESRITAFDGEYVTFWYDSHETGERVIETIHVYEFFKRLIIHISDRYFNNIRYYGFYSKEHSVFKKLPMLLSEGAKKVHSLFKTWRNKLRWYFNVDPLLCKSCNKVMELIFININGKMFFNST